MQLSAPVYKLKRMAKLTSRQKAISHSAALDQIAQSEGFKNWSMLSKAIGTQTTARKLLDQFSRGDLIVLGARPGHGKTTLALEIALEALLDNRSVFIFSLEETVQQIQSRIGQLNATVSNRQKLEICDSDAISAANICEKLAGTPAGTIAIVDYLQILDQMRSKPSLNSQLSQLSQFAEANGFVILFISQIDRGFEDSSSTLPTVEDIRQPNPIDMKLFNRTCFLHEGQIELSER